MLVLCRHFRSPTEPLPPRPPALPPPLFLYLSCERPMFCYTVLLYVAGAALSGGCYARPVFAATQAAYFQQMRNVYNDCLNQTMESVE